MYKVKLYQRANGKIPVQEYIKALRNEKEEDKVLEYIKLLKKEGLSLNSQYIKKIIGTELWELRPRNNRILFFCFTNDTFILLHSFTKKSQKTPIKEIETAERYMQDYLNRGDENG